jgi:hypothetical protein
VLDGMVAHMGMLLSLQLDGFRIESQYNYVNLFIKLQHCFRNDSFIARTLLAAIDHNSHLFRRAALNKDGKKKYNKVYSKRSKNWRVTTVLEEKTYDFWAALTSGILQMRIDDKDSILKKVELSAEHPKNICHSIAMQPVPATQEIVDRALSRFAKPT